MVKETSKRDNASGKFVPKKGDERTAAKSKAASALTQRVIKEVSATHRDALKRLVDR